MESKDFGSIKEENKKGNLDLNLEQERMTVLVRKLQNLLKEKYPENYADKYPVFTSSLKNYLLSLGFERTTLSRTIPYHLLSLGTLSEWNDILDLEKEGIGENIIENIIKEFIEKLETEIDEKEIDEFIKLENYKQK